MCSLILHFVKNINWNACTLDLYLQGSIKSRVSVVLSRNLYSEMKQVRC